MACGLPYGAETWTERTAVKPRAALIASLGARGEVLISVLSRWTMSRRERREVMAGGAEEAALLAASLARRCESTRYGFATAGSYPRRDMSDRWALVRGGAACFLAFLATFAQVGFGAGGSMFAAGGGRGAVTYGVDPGPVATGRRAARGLASSSFTWRRRTAGAVMASLTF